MPKKNRNSKKTETLKVDTQALVEDLNKVLEKALEEAVPSVPTLVPPKQIDQMFDGIFSASRATQEADEAALRRHFTDGAVDAKNDEGEEPDIELALQTSEQVRRHLQRAAKAMRGYVDLTKPKDEGPDSSVGASNVTD